MIRNNNKPHRKTEANQRRTESIIEAYYGKEDLRRTWELSRSQCSIQESRLHPETTSKD